MTVLKPFSSDQIADLGCSRLCVEAIFGLKTLKTILSITRKKVGKVNVLVYIVSCRGLQGNFTLCDIEKVVLYLQTGLSCASAAFENCRFIQQKKTFSHEIHHTFHSKKCILVYIYVEQMYGPPDLLHNLGRRGPHHWAKLAREAPRP